MKRINALGSVIVMILALTATAGTSSASASQFRAETYSTSVYSAQSGSHKIVMSGGYELICGGATMSGTFAAPSTTATLTPVYSSCKAFGLYATVSPKSCKYVFHNGGTWDIACSKEGDAIEVKTVACTVTIPPQTALGSVGIANTAGKHSGNRSITVTPNVTNVKYSVAGAGCPNPGTYEKGTYTGVSMIKGYNAAAVGVYIASEQVASPPLFEGEGYPLNVQAEVIASNIEIPIWSGTFSAYCSGGSGISKWDGSATTINQKIKLAAVSCNTTVSMNSCSFNLTGLSSGPNAIGSETIEGKGAMAITCSLLGDGITYNRGGCNIRVPAQSSPDGVHFSPGGVGPSRYIEASFEMKNLKYVAGEGCPEKGTYENGRLGGEWRLKGYVYEGFEKLGAQRGIWIQ